MSSQTLLETPLTANSGVPLYYQLISIIKRNISAGLLSSGDVLPSESVLCKNYNISRSTVRQAIGALADEGLVIKIQGHGTFVAEPKMRRRNENVYSFTNEIAAMGLKPSSTLIDFEAIPATLDLHKIFTLPAADSLVYRFTRIRRVNDEPLMLETSFYPKHIYPQLTRELVEENSIYSLLHGVGIIPSTAIDTYEAVKISHDEATLLKCKSGSAGFFHQRKTKSESGEVFEFTQTLIRGDRTKLEVMLKKDGVSFSRSVDSLDSE